MDLDRRLVVRTLLGLAGSLVLVWLLAGAVDLGAVRRELATADPWLFAFGLVSVFAALVCWSEALRLLLDAPRRGFLPAYLSGDLAKQVLPMGHVSGPALLAYAVGPRLDRKYDEALAVVTVTETLNLVLTFALAAVGLVAVAATHPVPHLESFTLVVVVGLVAVGGLGAVVYYRMAAVERAIRRVGSALQRVRARLRRRTTTPTPPDAPAVPEIIDAHDAAVVDDALREGDHRSHGHGSFAATLRAATANRREVLLAAVLVGVGRVLFQLPLYTGALALGHATPVGLFLFAVPLASLAMWLPLPGGLGGVEAALAGIVALVAGLDPAAAASVAILYRVCSWLFVVGVDLLAVAVGAVR